MKKKKVPHRDLIAKDMITSNKFRMQVIPNKKKNKKVDLRKEIKEYEKEKEENGS